MRGSSAAPAPTAAPTDRPPRGSLALLFDRDFGGLFWGKLIAVVGVWAYAVAAAIVVFDATGSTLAVGMVAAAQFVPQLVLAPVSGARADRGSARRQLVAGRVLCLVGAGGLAVWMQLVRPDGWELAVAVFIGSLTVGLGFVVGGPAMQSVVPRLVTREELPRAMGLNVAPMAVARIAGPVLGATFVAATGPAASFAFAALGQMIFLVALAFVRIPEVEPAAQGTDYSVRAAWRHVRSDRVLLVLLLAVAAVTFGAEPSITLAPALADEFGGGAALVGALTATFGAGSAVGILLVTWLGRGDRTTIAVVGGLACLTAGMVVAAVSPWVAGALIGFGVAGAGFPMTVTSVSTAVLLRVPIPMRGRVMAFWMMCFVGFRPIAALVAGFLADAVSVHLAIAAMAAVTLAALVMCVRTDLRAAPPADPVRAGQNGR